jgi:ribose transport system substrate-binding protein
MNTPGQIVDSGSFLVTTDTVDTYDQTRKDTSMQILADFQNTYLTCGA